ncbi:MAG: hypothetical protein J6Y33_03210 [Prevotella sp.]|nr:hypothetical protein [Prevotella sp.]
MSQPSTIPQELMTGALLHFESGVPISDLNVRKENKDRMARVDHVFWQWKKNPFLDVFALFKQLVKGKYSGKVPEWYAAQKDKMLFDFVVEHVAPPSRREDEMKVRFAAERAIQIGAETDNPQALVKGGKLLADVAHLNQPESDGADMSKAVFLPPVVTTSAKEIDDTKEDQTDEQARLIMSKYNAYVDEKRKSVDDRVEVMMARRNAEGKEENND